MAISTFELARREVRYAYEKVGFFRKHLEKAGVTPADIRAPEDWSRIPLTHKADYRRNFPAGVIASGYTLKSRHVMRFQSSGTEGERLVSVVLSYDLARRQATSLSVNPQFNSLWKPGLRLRTVRYAAPNCSDVECANPNSTMQDRMLPDGTLVLPVYHDLLTTPPAMANRALDEIAEYDPHLLFIDPTHFAFLVREMRRAGREPFKRQGVCINSGYTMCTRISRRQIREAFGPEVPFADMLGMSELGYLGFECPQGQNHLNDKDFYVELLRDGRPAGPGELAELVITTLEDKLSPHIRYATGDLFRLSAERCACGAPLPVVTSEGRAKNMLLRTDGSMLTPRELDVLVGPADWIDLYRMEQVAEDDFSFQYLRNDRGTAALEADLAARLRDALRTKHVRCSATNYLPADRGGKFISCVSAVSARRAAGG